jgi:c-di-GMP-related signal transduction protein
MKINSLIMNNALLNFNGYIALYKKGETKLLYILKDINETIYKSLLDTIALETDNNDKLEILSYIQIFKVNIKEIDIFHLNAINKIYDYEYIKHNPSIE